MSHGFDLNDPLICEGIVGDGCGGGRIFHIKDNSLKAYDPQTQEAFTLLEPIFDANKVSKNACILTVECENKDIKFDLSLMKRV